MERNPFIQQSGFFPKIKTVFFEKKINTMPSCDCWRIYLEKKFRKDCGLGTTKKKTVKVVAEFRKPIKLPFCEAGPLFIYAFFPINKGHCGKM